MKKPVWSYDNVPVGTEFELEQDLTPELVQEYCEAVGEDAPYYGKGSPLGYPIAPPTLVAQLALRLPKTKYETAGWVHVKHEVEFLAPARQGATLKLQGRVTNKYEKRGREYADYELSVRDADGTELVRGKYSMLFKMK